ncbi:DUF6236 family protein [Peribacillus simplex]|uniref:DUF6236 family protein n=1 Tax=Peribacillus simplex TaxID=1478 RepID=UPI003D2DD979
MRGVVISNVELLGIKRYRSSRYLDPIKLRQYLLYWDKIDYPECVDPDGFFESLDSPEINFLERANVLKRTKVNIKPRSSRVYEPYFIKAQLTAFKLNNELEKGCWTLAQSNAELLLPKEDAVLTRNLEVDLFQCLPIPSQEVSLADILLFKEHRRDELLEFRSLLDNLYLEIIASGDPDRVKVKNIEQLQQKLIEINSIMSESRIKRLMGNLKIEVNVSDMILKTAGAIGAATLFHFPVGVSAALGFASSFINVKSEFGLKPTSIPEGMKDYAYLYYAHKNLV